MLEDFLKSIPNELAKLAGAVNEAMQLTDLAWDLGESMIWMEIWRFPEFSES